MIDSRIDRAPSSVVSSSGEDAACSAASTARLSPVPMPMPSSAFPASDMIVRTSAKSRLIRPGSVIRSEMPCTPWRSTSSATRNASTIDVCLSSTRQQPVVRHDDEGVDLLRERLDAALGGLQAARALEAERLRDDADGQRAQLAGDARHHGRRARAGAAALAGGDEHHVRAAQQGLDAVGVLHRRGAAEVGVRARAEAARDVAPIWSVTCAAHCCSDCASVLSARNSTPAISASIMRLTALTPPPPTPTTRSSGCPRGVDSGTELHW